MSKASKSRRKARASHKGQTSPRRIVAQPRSQTREASVRAPVSVGLPAEAVVSPATGLHDAAVGPADAAPVVESSRTALEEAFFRRGHEVAQAAVIEPNFLVDEVTTSRHAQPRAVARRAQLRRVFAGVMGFASVLTVVVTAKALARHGDDAAPMDTALTVRHPIVASINLDPLAVETTVPRMDDSAAERQPFQGEANVSARHLVSTSPGEGAGSDAQRVR